VFSRLRHLPQGAFTIGKQNDFLIRQMGIVAQHAASHIDLPSAVFRRESDFSSELATEPRETPRTSAISR
jgi:hypothetical protein